MIYVVFIMTILLLYRIEQVARYIDLGAARMPMSMTSGAVVRTLKDIAFETHELASVDAHLLATAQQARSMVTSLSASLTMRIRLRICWSGMTATGDGRFRDCRLC